MSTAGKRRLAVNGCRVSFGGDENILTLNSGICCTTLNILKTTELYTLQVYISIKLYFLKKNGQKQHTASKI